MARKPGELQPAVFLDRDGVLNVDTGYVFRSNDLRLLPGVVPALNRLKKAGFLLIVVSNQSGVARGMFSTADVEAFNTALNDELRAKGGVAIDDFYYCPHHPQGTVPSFTVQCSCRKPEPGMLKAAAEKHGIDLAASFMVGDKADDIEAAIRAGVRGIQVQSRYGAAHHQALATVSSLAAAVPLIVHD